MFLIWKWQLPSKILVIALLLLTYYMVILLLLTSVGTTLFHYWYWSVFCFLKHYRILSVLLFIQKLANKLGRAFYWYKYNFFHFNLLPNKSRGSFHALGSEFFYTCYKVIRLLNILQIFVFVSSIFCLVTWFVFQKHGCHLQLTWKNDE